jgi:hypothetical protein
LTAVRRLAISLVVVVCLAVLLDGTAGARTHPQSSRRVLLIMHGWGSVTPVQGFESHHSHRCTQLPHCGARFHARQRKVTLVATPYKGWKFAGWGVACRKDRTRSCTLDLSRFPCPLFASYPPGARPCLARPIVGVTFVPAAPGLTRKNPVPVGTAHAVGNGFTLRIDSAQPNFQLSAAPGAGEEYFDARATLTYAGGGSSIPSNHLDLDAQGAGAAVYNDDNAQGCPAPGPQPRLDLGDPIASGQSVTGHVCWTIAASDEASLEMFFGNGTQDHFPGSTWFALH